jgi:acetone carboxylase gamma subunit
MKVLVTEYLHIDLDTEKWGCRVCGREHGSARDNYKQFLFIYDRNPQEIHRPILDPVKYPKFNFSPSPDICVIYEYYCPACGTMVETEYTVPGHVPLHDIEFDIDALKAQWANRREVTDPGKGSEYSRPGPLCGHDH